MMPELGHGLNTLLILGIALFAGTVGARVFAKIRVPQVVGSIIIGILIGQSGLGLIRSEVIQTLQPLNFFALGLIGFMIGGELRGDVLRKHGRQFLAILLAEGCGAFLLVGTFTGTLAWFFTGNASTSAALGLSLGAIASATAPAATVDVLWEYKTRGPLTTMVMGIVALDDGFALLLFGFTSSIAGILLGTEKSSFAVALLAPLYEIGGSLILGFLAGLLLNAVLKTSRDPDKTLAFSIGLVLLTSGLSEVLSLDIILAVMAFGATAVNTAPRRSQAAFDLVRKFAPPIYVLFFVFVGARLSVSDMPAWIWALAAVYVIGRTAGKMGGAYLGAAWSGAAPSVRRYLGLCLFSQAGVAVGLSILASQRFSGEMGNVILLVVTATTFLVQVIGPPCVKLAMQKAGECGLDATEEDLIQTYKVGDVMDKSPPTLHEETPFPAILEIFGKNESLWYPVVDHEQRLLGVLTVREIKEGIACREFQELVVAYDLMEPIAETTTSDTPLADAVETLKLLGLEGLPVVRSPGDDHLVGFLDSRALHRVLSEEILKRHSAASASEVSAPEVPVSP